MVIVQGGLDVPLDRVLLLLRAGGDAEVKHGAAAEPEALVLGQPALAPWPHLKAVLVLVLSHGAGDRVGAGPGLGEVGAVGPAVHGRGQDHSSLVLQAHAAGLAAAGPGGEVGHHAVVGAGDEAGLLQRRPVGEELADAVGHHRAVGGAHALDAAPLDAVLRRDAGGRAQTQLVGEKGHEDARPPFGHLPLKKVLVPLADFEAVALALGLVRVPTVGVVRGPALAVDAPHRPHLNSARATLLAHTSSPLAWQRQRQRESVSQHQLHHEREKST